MEFKRGFLKKHYATATRYTVASHPNHVEPTTYSDRQGIVGALQGQDAPTQKFVGYMDLSVIFPSKVNRLKNLAKTPAEEKAYIQGQVLVNFDLCQEGVDRIPMWLPLGRLELIKQRTYKRLPNLGGPNKDGERFLWEIRETGYAGKGVFAVKALQAGDLLLSERPLDIHVRSLPSFPEEEDYLRALHNRRSPKQQQQYLSLCNSVNPEDGVLWGIATTNRVGVFGEGDGIHGGVFAVVCRFNHSCGPNALWKWNDNTFSMEIHAVRRIEPNEEITVTYIDHRFPRDVRQRALQQWHFTCQCAWCSLSTEESLQSDRNRHEILNWGDNYPPVSLWSGLTPLSAMRSSISEGETIIEICKKEGLEMLTQLFAIDMVFAYSEMADTPNCLKYARMAFGIALARQPPGHQQLTLLQRYLENPRKAAGEAWGKRLPKNV